MKTKIFYFLLGAIIFSSITAIAVTNIRASEIAYNDTTVEGALNDVYSNLNTKIIINTFGTPLYNDVRTTLSSTTRNLTLVLPKGKYLIVVNDAQAWTKGSNSYNSIANASRTITCENNNCTITNITGRRAMKSTSSIVQDSRTELYYADMKDDEDTIYIPYQHGSLNNSQYPETCYVQAIPINE